VRRSGAARWRLFFPPGGSITGRSEVPATADRSASLPAVA
jgi:hypothetical protein